MAALMVAALAVTRRDRWLWGAVLVGLAAAVKLPGQPRWWGWCCSRSSAGRTLGKRVAPLRGGRHWSRERRWSWSARERARASVGRADQLPPRSPAWRRPPCSATGARGPAGTSGRVAPAGTELQPEKNVEHAGWRCSRCSRSGCCCDNRCPMRGAPLTTAGWWCSPRCCEPGSRTTGTSSRRCRCWRRPPLRRRGDLTLLAFVAALGLTAVLDPAEHVHWFGPWRWSCWSGCRPPCGCSRTAPRLGGSRSPAVPWGRDERDQPSVGRPAPTRCAPTAAR